MTVVLVREDRPRRVVHTAAMSEWELVVLGTAAQAPTRYRNHNGYFLRAADEGIVFDPGEGTQRQMAIVGVSPPSITRICVTHLHGDHCLGLPGLIQRLSLDRVSRPVPLHHPRSGAPYIERLRRASIFDDVTDIRPRPVDGAEVLDRTETLTVSARPLLHRVDTVGYRIEGVPHVNFDADALERLGVRGPDVGRLRREGAIDVDGRTITVDEVSQTSAGTVVAFVMDTAMCDDALELARDADLLICESTFLDENRDLATEYGHLTARQAAQLARDAGARSLLLTHFSQREPDTARYVEEAAAVFPRVVGADDGMRIPIRRAGGSRA
jgi:ribonuclease Z